MGRNGVTLGDGRQAVLSSYNDAVDLGDVIAVDQSRLRFGLAADTVVWLGVIDCGD